MLYKIFAVVFDQFPRDHSLEENIYELKDVHVLWVLIKTQATLLTSTLDQQFVNWGTKENNFGVFLIPSIPLHHGDYYSNDLE